MREPARRKFCVVTVRAASALSCVIFLGACGTLDWSSAGRSPYEMQQSALRAYDKGADAEAEALYLGLIRQAPNDPEHLLRLGNLYARSNRPDRAAETYTQALLLAPRDSRLWYNLGVIRQRQGHAALIQAHALMESADPLWPKTESLANCLAPADQMAVTPLPAGD